MSTKFNLTIITITKNNPAQLIKTVSSIERLCKKYGVKQIVVDTSSPATQKVNLQLCNERPWLDYRQGDWSGIAKSYNYGLSLVKDGWVWLLNASDYLNLNVDIEIFLNLLKNTQSNVLIFNVEGYQSGRIWSQPNFKQRAIPLDWIPQPGVIIRKEVFDKIGPFNENLQICLDTEYWIRLFAMPAFSYEYINTPLVKYDEKGMSSYSSKLIANEMCKIFITHPRTTLSYIINSPHLMVKIFYRYVKNLIS